jgi:hypothetical protein
MRKATTKSLFVLMFGFSALRAEKPNTDREGFGEAPPPQNLFFGASARGKKMCIMALNVSA